MFVVKLLINYIIFVAGFEHTTVCTEDYQHIIEKEEGQALSLVIGNHKE